ncbi:MAG TPA: helix-turn-helix domain-containing protein, partial [Gemmatimonadaceae bacterium]|nr:helix-turn-helix domain-containing protein [Gemmatimonadaceae bacterium]
LMRADLVDAAIVDLAGVGDDAWEVAATAGDFPSAPFVAILPSRVADVPSLARAAALECADACVEGVDDAALAALVEPLRYTARFSAALAEPPAAIGLCDPFRVDVWRRIVARAGRATTTTELAADFRVTREHLSRSFAGPGVPTLKRVIDLVRVLSAAELAKNPGYDVGDVARVLGFSSSSHLATTTQRLVGARPTSLARLRAIDLVERFTARSAGDGTADA